jgi:hypothetical protein
MRAMPPGRAGRPEAASSVAPIPLGVWALLASLPRTTQRSQSAGHHYVRNSKSLPAELELLREGLPRPVAAAADMARDDDAVLVDDRDCRMAEEPERAGELGVRIRE